MSNISTCSDLYYTDENGKEYSLLKLYAYGKCVWKKGTVKDMWQYTIVVTAGQEISLSVSTQGLNDTFDWGDGSTSIGYVNSHTYEKAGTYTISFTDIGKSNLYYGSSISPSTALRKIIHPSYCTKLYISSAENLEEIDFILPTSITYVENMGGISCGIPRVKIPKGVVKLNNQSFSYLSKLKSVQIPDTLNTIGDDTFRKCEKLEKITIPDSVTSIGNETFGYCTALKEIKFSENITTIPQYCCRDSGIEDIIIPPKVTKIDNYAFFQCSNIKSIQLNSGLKEIGEQAFKLITTNTMVTEIILPDTLETIRANAFDGWGDEYKGYCNVKSIFIPNSVIAVYAYAFPNMTSLTSLTVGTGIQYIGQGAFSRNDSLKAITIKGTPQRVEEYAFGYDTNGKKIDGFTVYGVAGSNTETYAKNNGYDLVAI